MGWGIWSFRGLLGICLGGGIRRRVGRGRLGCLEICCGHGSPVITISTLNPIASKMTNKHTLHPHPPNNLPKGRGYYSKKHSTKTI